MKRDTGCHAYFQAENKQFGDVALSASKTGDKITVTLHKTPTNVSQDGAPDAKSQAGLDPTSMAGQNAERTGPEPLNIAKVLTKTAAE